MASTNKTELGFNEWIGSDRPMMEDYNSDNTICDSELQKRYTKDEVDQLIQEKVNIGTEALTWIPLEFNAPYVSTGGNWGVKYAKDSLGNVYINGSFTNPNSPAAGDTLFTMPAGYRPQKYWEGYIVHARGYATITDMSPDGVCVIGAGAGTNPNPGGAYIIDICYKAA